MKFFVIYLYHKLSSINMWIFFNKYQYHESYPLIWGIACDILIMFDEEIPHQH